MSEVLGGLGGAEKVFSLGWENAASEGRDPQSRRHLAGAGYQRRYDSQLLADFSFDEGCQLAEGLENITDDLVVLDLDAETVLQRDNELYDCN